MVKIKEKEKAFIDANYIGVPSRKMAKLLYEQTGTKVGHGAILEYYRKKGYKAGVDGKFQKGFAGLDKEKLKNIQRTQFKKGHPGTNTKPIGAFYDRSDGYRYVKVADGDWRTEQVIEWEKANGKMPIGHKLLHLDGNSLNNSLDNLMLITDAESVTANGYRLTNDKDINKAIILNIRLKTKLKENKNDK